jgi:hypothetical protein
MLIRLYQLYHTYFRGHDTLEGKTPAEAAIEESECLPHLPRDGFKFADLGILE